MKVEQHHLTKLLTAHRNGFAVVGQVAATRNSLEDLCTAGYMEARDHQPDRRTKAVTRYYLTDAGRAYVEPIARKRKEQIDRQEQELRAKEALEAAAPAMLAAGKELAAAASDIHPTAPSSASVTRLHVAIDAWDAVTAPFSSGQGTE